MTRKRDGLESCVRARLSVCSHEPRPANEIRPGRASLLPLVVSTRPHAGNHAAGGSEPAPALSAGGDSERPESPLAPALALALNRSGVWLHRPHSGTLSPVRRWGLPARARGLTTAYNAPSPRGVVKRCEASLSWTTGGDPPLAGTHILSSTSRPGGRQPRATKSAPGNLPLPLRRRGRRARGRRSS